jgi:FkbM family methyltransferase
MRAYGMFKAVKRMVRETLVPWYHWEHYVEQKRRTGFWEVEFDLLDLLTDRRRDAVDIGMNLGLYATRLAPLCRTLHAFEPNPALIEEVRPRTRRNVTIHRVALSDRAGAATLTLPRRNNNTDPGMATLEGRAALDRYFSGDPLVEVETMEVALRTLDSFGLTRVGFLKMDVEGHEMPALVGGRETLERERPVSLIESQTASHPDAPENVFHFFTERGFTGVFVHDARVHPLAAFRRGVHQRESKPSADCAINFLFFPSQPADGLLAEMERRAERHRAARAAAPG